MARNEDFVYAVIASWKTPENQKQVALDIGANHGIYTALMAKKFSEVHAFEPHPDNIKRIQENVQADNVNLHQKVIGVEDGEMTLFINRLNHGGHSICQGLAETEVWGHSLDNKITVESITLDSFCKFRPVHFIKCDIEGGENEIFYHGENTLRENNITIVMETHRVKNAVEDQRARDRLFTFFSDLGYKSYNSQGKQVLGYDFDTHYLIEKVT